MSGFAPPPIDGVTYDPARDGERLGSQIERVKQLMADGQWRTLGQIVAVCGGTEASVGARLRDLRKPKFGAHHMEREYIGDGLWQYRVELNPNPPEIEDEEAAVRIATGAELIERERIRQQEREGYDPRHDDTHAHGELVLAAVEYALPPNHRSIDLTRDVPVDWPWEDEAWKPTPNDRVRELVKAGALIAAEIDRILRDPGYVHHPRQQG